MKVKFKRSWFAPGDISGYNDTRAISGQRFRKGVHDNVPEELRPYLPKDVEFLDDEEFVKEVEKEDLTDELVETLATIDIERNNADQESEKRDEADRRKEEIQQKRLDALAKARKAKAAKKKGK